MKERGNVAHLVRLLSTARVLVVGDVMLDVYEHCEVRRISPEAPVPIASVTEDVLYLGGAGNVARNVRALGATVSLVSVVGRDEDGVVVQKLLEENGIFSQGLVIDSERVTTTKKRIVSGSQQLIRIDREETSDVRDATKEQLYDILRAQIRIHDVVVISDYCKGLLTDEVIALITSEAQRHNKKIFVDSKSRHLIKYRGVYLIKPNKIETEIYVQETFAEDYRNLEIIGKKMSKSLSSHVVITLGADGMAIFTPESFIHKKTRAQEVYDVSGAGDTVLSVIATAVAVGASLETAVDLSNHAAGYVVSRLGTMVCDASTLLQMVEGSDLS